MVIPNSTRQMASYIHTYKELFISLSEFHQNNRIEQQQIRPSIVKTNLNIIKFNSMKSHR